MLHFGKNQRHETSLPVRSAFTLGGGGCGHRPAAAVAVSGANRGDCGRGFTGCRSRDGGHRFPGAGAPAFRNAAEAHPGRPAGSHHAGQSRVLGPLIWEFWQ